MTPELYLRHACMTLPSRRRILCTCFRYEVSDVCVLAVEPPYDGVVTDNWEVAKANGLPTVLIANDVSLRDIVEGGWNIRSLETLADTQVLVIAPNR